MTNHTYLPEGAPDMTDAEIEAYRLHCEEEEAIHFGTATRLVHCYLCEDDINLRMQPDSGPLRGVLRTSTSRGSDPTEILHLSCGHSII